LHNPAATRVGGPSSSPLGTIAAACLLILFGVRHQLVPRALLVGNPNSVGFPLSQIYERQSTGRALRSGARSAASIYFLEVAGREIDGQWDQMRDRAQQWLTEEPDNKEAMRALQYANARLQELR
jgi:hypothetical protein